MREETHTALVIKSFLPGSSRVVLFDKYDGKCNAFIREKYLPHGALIQYQITRIYRDIRTISGEIEFIPCYASEKSHHLFHHILELCHYFVPFEYKDETLFDFLYALCLYYQDTKGEISEIDSQCILFKLCVLLGIYPQQSFDNKGSLNIYDWIYFCIVQHPMSADFKTIRFLASGRKS